MTDRSCWVYRHSLSIAVVAVSLLILVALLVVVGATARADIYAADLALSWQNDLIHRAAIVATTLGTGPYLVGVAVVAGILVARQGRHGEAILPLMSLVVEWLANPALKSIVHRQRPVTEPWPPGLFGSDQYSFPSGHAMASMALFSLLACWAWSYSPARLRVPLAALAAAMPLAIGLSRVVLDVHWLSDVLGGWLAGLVVMTVVILAWLRTREPSVS